MDPDEHGYWGLDPGFAWPWFGSLSGERIPNMEQRGFEQSRSVSVCVYLWLH